VAGKRSFVGGEEPRGEEGRVPHFIGNQLIIFVLGFIF
jgi:hypothetical protein